MDLTLTASGVTDLVIEQPGGDLDLTLLTVRPVVELTVLSGAPGPAGADGADGADSFAGFGGIDYSDTEAGAEVELPAGEWVTIARDLEASPLNNRLQGAFTGHDFWSNSDHKIRPLAIYDVVEMNFYLRIKPGSLGGVVDVQLVSGSIEIAHRTHVLSGPVGEWDGIRVQMTAFARASFATNGAQVRLRSSVAASFDRFSPEFYPQSRNAA